MNEQVFEGGRRLPCFTPHVPSQKLWISYSMQISFSPTSCAQVLGCAVPGKIVFTIVSVLSVSRGLILIKTQLIKLLEQ